MTTYYETRLTGKKRLALELLSGAGRITYLTGFALYLTNGADGLGTVILSALFLLNCLCAAAVTAGTVARITQRIRKLGRRLTRGQLVTGFGFVLYGAAAGCPVTAAAAVIDRLSGWETGMCFAAQIMMAAGAGICFAFGLPAIRSFRPEK